MLSGSKMQFVILFVLIIVSAFFSMAETALISLSKLRLKNMIDEGVEGVYYIQKLLNNPNKMLNTILIGNNLVNIMASSMATSLAINFAGNNSLAIFISTVAITVIILIFGEVTPKTFAVQNQEKVSLFVSRPINFFTWFFTPLVIILNFLTGFVIKLIGGDINKSDNITESDIKAIINMGHEEGVIKYEEKTILDNLFEFADSNARDIMIPRIDIVSVPYESPYSDIRKIFEKERYTRIPVYKENVDNIVGILHMKDFIFTDPKKPLNIDMIMRKPYFTYEAKPTSDLFKIMKTQKISMAVVLDEYGGTSGILTLEDLIEEIVGSISDEYDDDTVEIKPITENEYLVEGSTKIEDVNDMLGIKLESEDFDSIGGYIIGLSGRIPQKGDIIEAENIKFIIEGVDKNRILEVRIHI